MLNFAYYCRLLLLIGCLCGAALAGIAMTLTTQEQSLGAIWPYNNLTQDNPEWPGNILNVSPDSRHVAYVMDQDHKQFVVKDGRFWPGL